MARLILVGLIVAAVAIVAVSGAALIGRLAGDRDGRVEETAGFMQKIAFALLIALILYTAFQGAAA